VENRSRLVVIQVKLLQGSSKVKCSTVKCVKAQSQTNQFINKYFNKTFTKTIKAILNTKMLPGGQIQQNAK
jgi:hypothetical protein